MKQNFLNALFILVVFSAVGQKTEAQQTEFAWTQKTTCAKVPVLANATADLIATDKVEVFSDQNSKSVLIKENGRCTMVYFSDARNGASQASELKCAFWLNYNIPSFYSEGFNFPAQLGTGTNGEWARSLNYQRGTFYLEAMFTVAAADPDNNTYLSKSLALECH